MRHSHISAKRLKKWMWKKRKRWEEDRARGLEGGQIHSTELQCACRVQMDELGTKTKKMGALYHISVSI